ncbi:MAG TPA: VWA domain-containing protein [Steroidobacteraceae bacterium]|nr:VWA domain-containing protein [Steroidobacteraceae bacterium]
MKMGTRRNVLLASAVLLAACAGQREAKQEQAAVDEAKRAEHRAASPPEVTSRPATAAPAEEKLFREADAAIGQVAGNQASAVSNPQQAMRVATQSSIAPAPCCMPNYQPQTNTERYQHLDENPVRLVHEHPVSTFSIDVDTGAYANVRRFLNDGQLPPQDAVRIEEMINYFDYEYAPPATRDTPFRVATELSPAPWNEEALLLKVGIKGFDIAAKDRPPANLVFLIDVSGSMQSPDKLPLLKNAFRLLTDQLTAHDRVSMVVYAGSSGVVLEPTAGDQKHKIREAIDRLEAGGSTNGAEGIQRAYQLAHQAHMKGAINRVVLATDGDFNVGIVNFEDLVDLAERERTSGVALTTLGFGSGNYNDQLLERLADAGNGNYAYVDTLSEARKVLVSELSSTLFTIAKDVKIQIEFNPAEVLEYRLIGYENRMLAREDFNNDKVDAGEIGAGHRVTALYEIVPANRKGRIDPLRYGALADATSKAGPTKNGEIAILRLRYKQPDADESRLLEYPVLKSSVVASEKTSPDFRFAASVAAFGQMLRGGKYTSDFDFEDVEALAKSALSKDEEGYRREFVSLVKLAQSLSPSQPEQEQAMAR